MSEPAFLDLPNADFNVADVVLLPLPFDGTACYVRGTAEGPASILHASTHVELWDEECDFDLDRLKFHTAGAVVPETEDSPETYLERVFTVARSLHERRHASQTGPLVIGIGGEHSVTPPLVRSVAEDPGDLSCITVVQFDAHSDLRSEYLGTPASHACAMRRVVERGAKVVAIGIRSAERAEFEFGRATRAVETFFAGQLADDPHREAALLDRLQSLRGAVYLTFDIDAFEVTYCPGTGTPQPGGLTWWQTLRYLRTLIQNPDADIIAADLVETAPQPGTQVNEFVAARLLAKMIVYRFATRE